MTLPLQGCFTGVESTPKITYKDVKENNADRTSAEEALATTFTAPPFGEWENGKRFYVTSDRIGLVMSSKSGTSLSTPSEGDVMRYRGTRTVTDLTGREVTEFMFTLSGQQTDTLTYRTNATMAELNARRKVEVPFTIDLSLVDKVKEALVGKTLYVRTPLWFNDNQQAVEGRKFVKVTVNDVLPANEVYPMRVLFTDDAGVNASVYMSADNGNRWSPREFAAVFSFTDPHLEYPKITDEMWDYIKRNRVKEGMTKPEARLALGDPANIDRGHDHSTAYERWNYTNGIYLIFEDGLLTRFNK